MWLEYVPQTTNCLGDLPSQPERDDTIWRQPTTAWQIYLMMSNAGCFPFASTQHRYTRELPVLPLGSVTASPCSLNSFVPVLSCTRTFRYSPTFLWQTKLMVDTTCHQKFTCQRIRLGFEQFCGEIPVSFCILLRLHIPASMTAIFDPMRLGPNRCVSRSKSDSGDHYLPLLVFWGLARKD